MVRTPVVLTCAAEDCAVEVLLTEPRHLSNITAAPWRCPGHKERK